MPRDYLFGQNDRLVLTAWNSLASVVLTVQGLMENSSAEFVPFSFTLTPTSNRVATVGSHLIGLGFLHNLVVFASAGSPVRGQTYCRLTKRYGTQAVGIDTAVIAQGYVADGEFLQYPGGKFQGSTEGKGAIRSVSGTDPAVDTEISEAVPTGALWRLLSFRANLVTDANAAARQVDIVVDDGTNELYRVQSEVTQALSLTYQYSFAPASMPGTPAADAIVLPAPTGLMLPAAATIATSTLNRQATDNWGAPQLLVEEWLQP